MKDRQLFIFLTFLPIALAIFFWDLDTRIVDTQPQENALPAHDLPLTVLDMAKVTQYDLTGNQAQHITSIQLLSKDYEEAVEIQQPVITLETEDGLWLVQSKSGRFSQIENLLSLFGEVTLTQSKGQSPVQMITEHLDYYPADRLAETSTPVVIETEGHHIESKGIIVDLAQSIYTLPERVRSKHEPM